MEILFLGKGLMVSDKVGANTNHTPRPQFYTEDLATEKFGNVHRGDNNDFTLHFGPSPQKLDVVLGSMLATGSVGH